MDPATSIIDTGTKREEPIRLLLGIPAIAQTLQASKTFIRLVGTSDPGCCVRQGHIDGK